MLILIDGYNMIAPVAPPRRGAANDWLRVERQRLIHSLATQLGEALSRQTTVVFDAAGAPAKELARLGLESKYVEQGIQIEFSVDHEQADDRIAELIGLHSSPKRLTVVSSDHRVQISAQRRGATAIDSEVWWDALADGRIMLAIPWPPRKSSEPPISTGAVNSEKGPVDPEEVEHWLKEFGFSEDVSPQPKKKANPFPKGYGEDLL